MDNRNEMWPDLLKLQKYPLGDYILQRMTTDLADMNKERNQTVTLLHYFIHCAYTHAIKLLTSATI